MSAKTCEAATLIQSTNPNEIMKLDSEAIMAKDLVNSC